MSLFLFFKYVFTYGCAGSSCCTQAFSGCRELGLLFVAECGLQ